MLTASKSHGGDSAAWLDAVQRGQHHPEEGFRRPATDLQVTFTDHNFDGVKHDSCRWASIRGMAGQPDDLWRIHASRSKRQAAVITASMPWRPPTIPTRRHPATHFGGFCFSGSGTEQNGRIKTAALGDLCRQDHHLRFRPHLGPLCRPDLQLRAISVLSESMNYSSAPAPLQANDSIDFYTRLTFAETRTERRSARRRCRKISSTIAATPPVGPRTPDRLRHHRGRRHRRAQCAISPTSSITPAPPMATAASPPPTSTRSSVWSAWDCAWCRTSNPRIYDFDHNTFQMVGGARRHPRNAELDR